MLGVDSVHDVVCRSKGLIANHNCVSGVGRTLSDEPWITAKRPLLQTIKIDVSDLDQLIKPALGGKTDSSHAAADQFHRPPSF